MENLKGKRILIIEDNDVLGDVIEKKLKTEGYTTLLIKDGKEGLDQVDQFSPDLILLDILLPTMNGYEVLEAMSKKGGPGAFPPTIMISNSGQPVEISKVLQLGAKDYLVKVDFTPDEVLHKVETHLSSSSADSLDNPLRGEDFKILIVEDDNFLRDLLARKLTHEQYNLLVAADGEEGIELATNERPSIILLDLILPGINGFEVLTQLRQNPETQNIPVIILSNLGQESDIQKAKEIGANEFLIKSNFSIDEVISKMQKLVSDRRNNPALATTAPPTPASGVVDSSTPPEPASPKAPPVPPASTPVATPTQDPFSPPMAPTPSAPPPPPPPPEPAPEIPTTPTPPPPPAQTDRPPLGPPPPLPPL